MSQAEYYDEDFEPELSHDEKVNIKAEMVGNSLEVLLDNVEHCPVQLANLFKALIVFRKCPYRIDQMLESIALVEEAFNQYVDAVSELLVIAEDELNE